MSDPHFGHANSIRFDNRPFLTVEDMDNELIKRWNSVVKADDIIYILGDISWHNTGKTFEIFSQLNGEKHLIRGNHDKSEKYPVKLKVLFKEIVDYKEIKVDGIDVILCHYPIPCFNKHFYGSVHLYGHVHNSHENNYIENLRWQFNELDIPCNMYNVGCMMTYMDYTPKTLLEIISADIILNQDKHKQIEREVN